MKLTLTIVLLFALHSLTSQNNIYLQAFNKLDSMLSNETKGNFKEAVFITENAYYGNQLNKVKFEASIAEMVLAINLWIKNNHLTNYSESDSLNFTKNAAIFKLMTDTVFISKNTILSTGYEYDFDDFFGEHDWSKQFVSKLLYSGTGNCHSMPFLYKILANEINAEAWLSLAPNHIYIKCRSKDPKISFYNTELTSKCFPVDAWLMTSSGITTETIISGIWMESLTEKQTLALCVLDLAHGYMHKENNYNKEFVIRCCNLALKHYPHFANALLLKGEVYREMYLKQPLPSTMNLMNNIYTQLFNLGYRDVPKATYLAWLEELAKNQNKYNNKNLKQ